MTTSQDCKEYQGELFGICNLFRDLSDKLFTSEIIELHEKGLENEHCPGRKQDLAELGMYFLPSKGANEMTSSETSKPKDTERPFTTKPVLSDLGKHISSVSSSVPFIWSSG